jgi:type IX secretion system PorP/SprF family membrane protein
MNNRLIYNPGYAGTSGAICGVAQFRQQWVNYTGAPQTFALAADMRLPGIPLGVGLTVMTDKIGPQKTLFLRGAGSWNIDLKKGTLGIGADVGVLQKSINNEWIVPEPGKVDPTIPGGYEGGTNPSFGKAGLDLGFGAFYNNPGKFYAGISSTHLPAQKLTSGKLSYDIKRNFYVMTGYTFNINKWNKVTPNVKAKTDLAATAIDANLTYMWSDMIWLGGTYRFNDAACILLGYQGHNGKNTLSYKIGYSYDFTLSKIKGYTSGTHEIVLGFCFLQKEKKITTYGDPRFLN